MLRLISFPILFVFSLSIFVFPSVSQADGNGLFLNGTNFAKFVNGRLATLAGANLMRIAHKFSAERIQSPEPGILVLENVMTQRMDVTAMPLRGLNHITVESAGKVCERIDGAVEKVVSYNDIGFNEIALNHVADATMYDEMPGAYSGEDILKARGAEGVNPGKVLYAVHCRVDESIHQAYAASLAADLLANNPAALGELLFDLGINSVEQRATGQVIFAFSGRKERTLHRFRGDVPSERLDEVVSGRRAR